MPRRYPCATCGDLVDERSGRAWEARVEFISPDHKRRMPGGVIRLGFFCQQHADEKAAEFRGRPAAIWSDQGVLL